MLGDTVENSHFIFIKNIIKSTIMTSKELEKKVAKLEKVAKNLDLNLFSYRDCLYISDVKTGETININEHNGLETFPRS